MLHLLIFTNKSWFLLLLQCNLEGGNLYEGNSVLQMLKAHTEHGCRFTKDQELLFQYKLYKFRRHFTSYFLECNGTR